ncbi:glutaredoxin domain-containing cysteine-rich protein 2 [Spea bombifrons]|uniref:glutaredoxin domain-containing cysteine-rich protein 2 n=1 Tax=Spea bombifrons TaxID=233779 RepID=UPI002349F432|nr:glutaredoxin domain-containing cysteine-rich protein 2 [Spea bombifrons]
MEELQRKLSQRHEERPRKVRFKISSAYSGRVLKQVFEDGHELELPEEEYPHSFLHDNFEARTSEHCYSQGEVHHPFYPTTHLTAHRISVFRDGTSYRLASDPLFTDCHGIDKNSSSIIDFNKIIIYTSNLKIIRTPINKTDISENSKYPHIEGKRTIRERESCLTTDDECTISSAYMQNAKDGAIHQCPQCKGSGSAPCTLCHGSKFSMLANRFKESYRSLRCPACDEKGLQPCQTCTH